MSEAFRDVHSDDVVVRISRTLIESTNGRNHLIDTISEKLCKKYIEQFGDEIILTVKMDEIAAKVQKMVETEVSTTLLKRILDKKEDSNEVEGEKDSQ